MTFKNLREASARCIFLAAQAPHLPINTTTCIKQESKVPKQFPLQSLAVSTRVWLAELYRKVGSLRLTLKYLFYLNFIVAIVISAMDTQDGDGARVKRTIGASIHNFSPFLLLDEFFVQPPAGFPNHVSNFFSRRHFDLALTPQLLASSWI